MTDPRVRLAVIAAAALAAAGAAAAHGPGPPHRGPPALAVHGTGAATLWIVHVEWGCHVWSDGKRHAASVSLSLSLGRGGRLEIVNKDFDAHQLRQTTGPRIRAGRPITRNHGITLVFQERGLYRFRVDSMDVSGPRLGSVGPDEVLTLAVRVHRSRQ